MIPLKPALQYSQGRSRHWSGAKLTNCFAEKADGDKRADIAVIATPGLTLFGTGGRGPHRGHIVVGTTLYVVSGVYLYEVDQWGTETLLGEIPGTGSVSIAANYTEVCIASDNGIGYVWSDGALHTPVPFEVSGVLYADGFMIWSVKDSEQFFISALDDALTYDAADIASVEGAPDSIVGMINDHRDILFFGAATTEIFANTGDLFPFSRQGNAFIERGCFDRDSIAKLDNSVYFVGDDKVVYRLNGYQPERISTHAIEYHLGSATYSRAFTYPQEGHTFYCLEMDAGTFCFDPSVGAWHQRKSWEMTHWRVNGAVQAYGQTLFTDRTSGDIYTASLDSYTENGEPIALEITLPTIEAGRERMIMYSFEVVCETGVGNVAETTPQIMLTYSDDGGHLWSDEMWRTMGRVGEYRTRAVWRRLGQFRNRQMKLRITDPVQKMVISYHADIG